MDTLANTITTATGLNAPRIAYGRWPLTQAYGQGGQQQRRDW
jgi:hypothetical protein